jgi:FkbM family methyltransferase
MQLGKYTYYLESIFRLLAAVRPTALVVRIFLNLAPPGLHLLHLPRKGACFLLRSPMDLWSVKETFLDQFYERGGFEVQAGWSVMDIGAGIGDFTVLAAQKCGDGAVYAFEPYLESFRLLQKNLALNHLTNVVAEPWAVAPRSGELVLDLSGGEPLQVLGRPAGGAGQQGQVVKATSLADAWRQWGIGHIDLIKLDCEGAEFEILLGLPADLLARVRRIVLEYHDGVAGHSHRELVEFLQGNGYQVNTLPNRVHDFLGYLYARRT